MTRFHAVWLCLVLTGVTAASLAGCGSMRERRSVQYAMQPGDAVPGASGKIIVGSDEDNQRLKIQVAHLPPPGQLHPSLSTFVVWGSQPGAPPATAMNLGQISIGRDRQGSLEVVTPYPNLDITVTAESTGTPEQPSDYVILQGNVMGGALR